MVRALEISPPERSETNGRIIRANFASWSEDAPVRRALMTQNGQITEGEVQSGRPNDAHQRLPRHGQALERDDSPRSVPR